MVMNCLECDFHEEYRLFLLQYYLRLYRNIMYIDLYTDLLIRFC
jgi:hypothetical protein